MIDFESGSFFVGEYLSMIQTGSSSVLLFFIGLILALSLFVCWENFGEENKA